MSSPVNDILQDILSALRASDHFAEVTMGPPASSTVVPRAWVVFRAVDVFCPDDEASGSWGRLRGQIVVRTRNDRTAEGIIRAEELCHLAVEALLGDVYRGGLCCDLPVGQATGAHRRELNASVPHPEAQMSCDFSCHFEMQGGE